MSTNPIWHMLTSAVMRMDVAVFDTIEELARGTLETGRTSHILRQRCRPRHDQRKNARSLQAEIEDVSAEIVAGMIPIASSVT